MKKTSQINTYAYLFNCSRLALDNITEGDPLHENTHYLITYYTFLALTIEAFINHVGLETYNWWEEEENGLNIKSKIRILVERYDITYEKGNEPFQSVNSLITFRNQIVHGKTQIIIEELNDDQIQTTNKKGGMANWEKFILNNDPKKVLNNVEEFAMIFWQHLDKSKEYPYPFGLVRSVHEMP